MTQTPESVDHVPPRPGPSSDRRVLTQGAKEGDNEKRVLEAEQVDQ